ncbi:unnamed protein product [Somion occarium]|uniref:Fungal-type protein kinase domain-containing protein n=1 Tax=Somion occarium TaxID=3059160 RepID=A0ABP1DQJ3_9APHY
MPPRGFLEAFMRLKILRKLNPEDLPEVDFSEIPLKKLEVEMYQPLCDAINDSGVCSGFKLIDVSSSVDGNGIPLRPDLAFVPTDAEDLMDYTVMECFVEAKLHDLADPFYGNTLNNTIEKMVGESAETRGQTISYAAALLSRQHRTFAFSILVFDYVEEPDILLEFFWCYARLTREERGFDPTVVPASAAEAKLLSDALSQYIKESQPRNVSYLQPKPDSTYPFSKMLVPTPNGTRELIIGKPFWDADSPCGRATRAYAAYDMVEKKVVFAKDSWRDEDKDILSEAVIYDTLQKSNVPFLPEVIAAGDVYMRVKKKKKFQRTLTQSWAVRSGKAVMWRLPCAELRTLVHCRVVQQLAYPLTSARSSKEAVQAIRDALEAIKVAYHDGKIFHRDISTGNIMISQSGRGVLNDWDHGLRVILRNTLKAYRTGTWQFISILLLQNPLKGHDVHDDLESSFWVLLYVSLHYFKHNQGQLIDLTFFNECKEHHDGEDGDGEVHPLGGLKKSGFLSHRLKHIKWRCAPLNSLIHAFGALLNDYQYYYEKADGNDDKSAEAQFKAIQEQLDQVDIVLSLFDTALASDEWPENDALPDQFPRMTDKQEDQMIHDLKSQAIATAALEKQAAANRRASPISTPTRSALPGVRSSARLVQRRDEQLALTPEAGPSQLLMSSRSTVKRTVDEVPAELPVFRSKRAKTAPERRPLKRAPKPPPPERPVAEHRYPTRSKSNGSRRGNSLKKPQEEDVEMQDVRRRNPSRSRTKSKSKDTRRVQATASEKSTEEKRQTRRKGRQPVKSTAGNGPSRPPPKSSTRRPN